MSSGPAPFAPFRQLDRLGQMATNALHEVGMSAALVAECLYWLAVGRMRRQPVRRSAVFLQMMDVGVRAVPIVATMAATIGVMLGIQGIHTLRTFGAESQVTIGIAFSMVREFAPLITGILVAGRSGSALAARLGTMKINQEIDALRVMGINPVRFLVAPALFAALIMVPSLTILSGVVGILASGVYVGAEIGISLSAYIDQVFAVLSVDDVLHGVGKSVIFAVLIAVIGVVNGALVSGGAEGIGKYTTRAVVQCISAIIVTDMLFALVLTR